MTELIDAPWGPHPGTDEGYALFAKERRAAAHHAAHPADPHPHPAGPGAPRPSSRQRTRRQRR